MKPALVDDTLLRADAVDATLARLCRDRVLDEGVLEELRIVALEPAGEHALGHLWQRIAQVVPPTARGSHVKVLRSERWLLAALRSLNTDGGIVVDEAPAVGILVGGTCLH